MAASQHLTHTRFIVNPAARNGKTGTTWGQIWQHIQKIWPHKVDYQLTRYPGHAISLSQRAPEEGVRTVIAVGGDGTVNEVVNGIMPLRGNTTTQPVLGVLELGTGGDFARTLQMPRGVRETLKWLLDAVPRPVDVGEAVCRARTGEMCTRYFINILDFGLGGSVVQWVNSHSKRLGGTITFLTGILINLAKYRNKEIRFRVDGAEWQHCRVNNVILANGRYFGGGLLPAPMAMIHDGQLEGIVIGDIGRIEAVFNLKRLREGRHLAHPKIMHFAFQQFQAESMETVYVDADGELIGTLPLSVRVLPGALRVLSKKGLFR